MDDCWTWAVEDMFAYAVALTPDRAHAIQMNFMGELDAELAVSVLSFARERSVEVLSAAPFAVLEGYTDATAADIQVALARLSSAGPRFAVLGRGPPPLHPGVRRRLRRPGRGVPRRWPRPRVRVPVPAAAGRGRRRLPQLPRRRQPLADRLRVAPHGTRAMSDDPFAGTVVPVTDAT
jgi:hypothetical protein